MSDLILAAPRANVLVARLSEWLEFDAAKIAGVEAAYDTYIAEGRPGVCAIVGLGTALVLGIFVAFIASAFYPPAVKTAGFVTVVVVQYAAFGVSIALCPEPARRMILHGCTNLSRSIVLAVCSSIAVLILELVLMGLMQKAHIVPPKHPANLMAGGFVFAALYATVLAPVCEEFFVQGWFQTRVRRLGGFWSSVVATLFFVLIHVPTNPFDIVRGMNLGVNAAFRASTRSLGASIAAHASNNGVAFLLFLLARAAAHHPH